jgi:hypothetical protein
MSDKMCRMRSAALILSFSLLCGCDAARQIAGDDFGAANAARAIASAQDECTAAGYEDLPTCSEAPRETASKVRRAALTAIEVERMYSTHCAEAIGSQKCNDMLMSAYFSAQSRQSNIQR